jgi:hypothetical protein
MAFMTGTFDVRPREILLNVTYGGFTFSPEFRKYAEDKNPVIGKLIHDKCWDLPEIRTHPEIIALVKEFGVSRAAGEFSDIVIEEIPGFYTWTVTEYDGTESLNVEFPWQDFAIALATNDEMNPLVQAYRNGILVGIEERKPRFLSLEEWDAPEREVDLTEWGGEDPPEDRGEEGDGFEGFEDKIIIDTIYGTGRGGRGGRKRGRGRGVGRA